MCYTGRKKISVKKYCCGKSQPWLDKETLYVVIKVLGSMQRDAHLTPEGGWGALTFKDDTGISSGQDHLLSGRSPDPQFHFAPVTIIRQTLIKYRVVKK